MKRTRGEVRTAVRSLFGAWRLLFRLPCRCAGAAALGALLGWCIMEPFFEEGGCVRGMGMANSCYFPVTTAMISAFLVLAVAQRGWRSRSAASDAVAAWAATFATACLVLIPSHLVYFWLAPSGTPVELPAEGGLFLSTMVARSAGWGITSLVIGVGTCMGTWRWRDLGGAVPGSVVGGLLAGLLFDPVYALVHRVPAEPAWLSRLLGLVLIAVMTGFVTGLVKPFLNPASLLGISGSRLGRRFPLTSEPCFIGSDSSCRVNLAGDDSVEPFHAVISMTGPGHELRTLAGPREILVNGRTLDRVPLQDGDRIRIGDSEFVFSEGSDCRR